MGLTLIVLSLLLLGLGLFQAWMLWYVKRETARLDQRLDESLDDQDLLDFQDRLQGLIQQARSTGQDMVQTVERRQDALEKTLVLVREAEKNLVARAQILAKSAEAMVQRAEKLDRSAVEISAPEPAAPPVPAAIVPVPPDERSRSYLVRPQPTIPAAPPPAVPPGRSGNRNQRIYDLADRGLDRDQIARETGVLPGEVELILNLRPRRR